MKKTFKKIKEKHWKFFYQKKKLFNSTPMPCGYIEQQWHTFSLNIVVSICLANVTWNCQIKNKKIKILKLIKKFFNSQF